jgi:hypothetical protein
MRANLLGRLNARSQEDVARIAATWRIAAEGRDRLGLVASLYRALTDIRTVRDIWQELPEDERALIVALDGEPGASRTMPELAAALDLPEEEIRRRAVSLFQKGLVVREGDDAELKVGELPKLFLPRELGALFRRVRAEMAAGDVSEAPLDRLLANFDDVEIEQAADVWGVHVVAGLKKRADLVRLLLAQVEDPLRRETVTAKLTGPAAKIWRALRSAPPGLIDLDEALAAAEFNDRDPRARHRGRLALADLEEKLLVLHAYRADGGRAVFVPRDIAEPGQRAAAAAPPPPVTLTLERLKEQPRPFALAWDLMTVLRALTSPGAPATLDLDEAPRAWLRGLNETLWNRGAELPPEGYLAFLIDLAVAEQLLTEADGGRPGYTLTPEMRAWRARGFAEQASRLRSDWLRADLWIEGDERGEVDVWGADWPGFRLKLLAQLSAFADRQWRSLDDSAVWLARRDPEMLGGQFRAATARATEISGDDRASRSAAIAEVVAVTLRTAGVWFGLIETAYQPRQPLAMRLTALGAALASGQAAPAEERVKPALEVTPEAEVLMRDATPLWVWSLSAFADLAELGETSRYRLNEASVRRALAAGFDIGQITAFLTKESGKPLPPAVVAKLASWGKEARRVRLTRAFAIETESPADAEELARILEAAGQRARQFDRLIVVDVGDQSDERLGALLRANGYMIAAGAGSSSRR